MAVDPAPPIIFIRHGQTDWNAKGLIQGSIDTDMNATGHAQAQTVADLLACRKAEWRDFQVIVSPQRRARQTADYITKVLSKSINRTDERVRELGFGIWEGKPFSELKASPAYPADPDGRFYWRPEGGESYEDGVARINDWRATLTTPTIVISHGAVGRCLMGAVAGLGPRELVGLCTPQGAYCLLQGKAISWVEAQI